MHSLRPIDKPLTADNILKVRIWGFGTALINGVAAAIIFRLGLLGKLPHFFPYRVVSITYLLASISGLYGAIMPDQRFAYLSAILSTLLALTAIPYACFQLGNRLFDSITTF